MKADQMTTVRRALAGVSGVHVTPYRADGEIDERKLEEVVAFIAEAGVDNIVTAGNTGEFYALTLEEVIRCYQCAVRASEKRSLVTAGVGRSLRDAERLVDAAGRAGVDAVMIHQPPDPFMSPRGMVAYSHRIADLSPAPVILYVRNDNFAPSEFDDLLGHPNIAGVKYAAADVGRLAERVRAGARAKVPMICGLAEAFAAPFHANGAVGFTSGLVNVLPHLSCAVRDALRNGHYVDARARIDEIAEFEAMRTMHYNGCNVTVVKEAMGLLGMHVGPVRPPGTPALDAASRERLARYLADRGQRVWRQAA